MIALRWSLYAPPARGAARLRSGWIPWALLVCALGVLAPGAMAGSVLVGRFNMMGNDALMQTAPVSGQIQFAVDASNGTTVEFHVTPPEWVGPPDTRSASSSRAIDATTRRYMLTPVCTGEFPNGTWTVDAVGNPNTSNQIDFSEVTFEAVNLNVWGLGVSPPDVQIGAFFASVLDSATGNVQFTATWSDGYEVQPPWMSLDHTAVDMVMGLRPLGLGTASTATVEGHPGGAGSDVQCTLTLPPPGLYYMDAYGTERVMGMYPDYGQSYWTDLAITKAEIDAFAWQDDRAGQFYLRVKTTDVPLTSAITGARYAWRNPDGTLHYSPGYGRPDDSVYPDPNGDQVHVPPHSFPLAGTYLLGVSYEDSHERPHDTQSDWCVPKAAPIEIPASAHFAGSENSSEPEQPASWRTCTQNAYDELAEVLHPLHATTFFSARAPEGTRGGVVDYGTVTRFVQACDDDQMIHFRGHGSPGGLQLYDPPAVQAACTASQLPADMSQARLVFLSTCHGLNYSTGVTPIGQAMIDRGAAAVIGYSDVTYRAGCNWIDERIWLLLAKETCDYTDSSAYGLPWTVSMAVERAYDDALAEEGVDFVNDNHLERLKCRPVLSDLRLPPAF